MEPIIEIKNLTHIYSPNTPFEQRALDSVNLTIYQGETLGIIGRTGSGKSTLIQHLNGLVRPTSGQILFEGQDIWSSKELTHTIRFQVGLVFQYPEYQLFEETVYKDIAFGPRNMKLDEGEIDRRVRRAAAFAGGHCGGHRHGAQGPHFGRAHRRSGPGGRRQHSGQY